GGTHCTRARDPRCARVLPGCDQCARPSHRRPTPPRRRAVEVARLPVRECEFPRRRIVVAEITAYETEQIEKANASGLTPVVFIHGLWLLPSSWDRWRGVFEAAGYTTLAPGWPDDPNTV